MFYLFVLFSLAASYKIDDWDTFDCPPGPECGENEIFTNNRIICPPQSCESIYTTYACEPQPPEPGCDCIDGYLRNSEGVCIPSDDCPVPGGCNGDPNATNRTCPNPCPPTCENPSRTSPCTKLCPESGCECNDGYIIDPDGKCVLPENCPGCGCNGDPNAIVKSCPDPCPPTCDNPVIGPCQAQCLRYGCECKEGYILSSPKGKCIPRKHCPGCNTGCNGDPNAEFTECTSKCPRTCDNFNIFCKAPCQPPGCQCKEGYVLSKGKCIKPEQCTGCNGDPNAEYTTCTTACPKTCEKPYIVCKAACQPPGCQCKPGYVLSNGKCIKPEQCPATCECNPGYLLHEGKCVLPDDCPGCNGDPNAEFTTCTSLCPKTCDNPNDNCKAPCQPPGCKCKPGYVLSQNPNGKCIKPKECPAKICKGQNEEFTDCTGCEGTCNNRNLICPAVCGPPGCQCKPGYVRSNGQCILPQNCPEGCNGDPNATNRTCPNPCPVTCENPTRTTPCTKLCPASGCECNDGYIIDPNGKCVLPENCTGCECNGDPNAIVKSCPDPCPPTCDNPVIGPCQAQCLRFGCECKEGYILSSPIKGKCILRKHCPDGNTGCNGDPNATFKECGTTCPATCANPKPTFCPKKCLVDTCECNPGYLLHQGRCILPEQCPGCKGDPNATFKTCATACPATCANPKPKTCPIKCIATCECNPGYLLHEGKCVLPDDCPGCNGDPNAEFTTCTSLCPKTCDNPNDNCKAPCQPPGCKCKPGYVLSQNPNGKCIKPKECPAKICKGQNEEFTDCTGCEGTCNNRNLICPAVCGPPGCQCKPGYVRSNGQCILPENCLGCNGDPNAEYTTCTTLCPKTCENPNIMCKAPCQPPGCQCKPGYVLSNGKCIKLEQCPGTCPTNEVFVKCKYSCPSDYCPTSDTRARVSCDPRRPCPPGCVCKAGYLRKSRTDKRCIKASTCPKIKCTRPNEVWCAEPSSCLIETCGEYNKPRGVCEDFYPQRPKCICREGYYRNKDDICVPAKQCTEQDNEPYLDN